MHITLDSCNKCHAVLRSSHTTNLQMASLLVIAGAAALGANVHIRHPGSMGSVCLDYAGATDTNPIKFATCKTTSPTQMFGFDPATGFIHLGGNPSCQEGPPCCIENFFGGSLTIWGCSDPSGKKFSYNNQTGQIMSQGGCVTATHDGANAGTKPCNASDPAQSWAMEAGNAPPGPVGNSCKALGCDISWRPGLPCQCNRDCCSYGNCCSDFHTTCGSCAPRPAPPPWPCTPCWRCGTCPPGPAPGTSCPNMAGTWTFGGTSIVVTQEKCAIDAKGPARSWQTAIGSFTNEWNIQLKVVTSAGSQTWNGHVNGCSPSSCNSGDTVTWTEPNGVTATWTKQ